MRPPLLLALVPVCLVACKPANPAARQHTPKPPPLAPGADPSKVVEIKPGHKPAATAAPGAGGGAATSAAFKATKPGDPKAGEAVYKRICMACHQPDGKGLGGMLGANFVDDKTRLAKSDAELFNSVTLGKKPAGGKGPFMPPQGGVAQPQEIRDALAYIRKQFGGKK